MGETTKMKKKQGFIKRTAIKATLTLAGLAALLFGGCSAKDDSPQITQDEQGNYVSTSTRQELNESLFEHYGTLTKADKSHLLQDTTITEAGNESLVVSQTMDFGTLTPRFAKDNLGNLGVFLHAAHDDVLYTMNWKFQDGFTSSIDANGNLIDLLQKELNIGGKNFRVTKAKTQWTGGDVDEVQLELMTGKVTATLNVGDSMMLGTEGVDYDVALVSTSDNGDGTYSAKWQVNGEVTDNLGIGALDVLVNGQFIGTANASNGNATFSIGAQKISITDTDVNDADFSGTVSGNGIFGSFLQDTDARAKISATVNGSEITINSLAYELLANTQTDTDVFVAPTERLSDHLDNPGASLVGVGFDGLRTKRDDGKGNLLDRVYSSIDFVYTTFGTDSSSYKLSFTNKEGTTYSNVPFIHNAGSFSGLFLGGEENDKLVMTEASSETDYNIGTGDNFVLTTELGRTFVYRYTDLTDDGNGNYTIELQDRSGGQPSQFAVDSTGIANIIRGGITFEAHVDLATGNMAVDQNADGAYTGAEIPIMDRYGAKLTVPSVTQTAVTANVSTLAEKIDGMSTDEVVDLEFCPAGNGMDVTWPMVPRVYEGVGEWKGQTRYGVKTTLKDSRDVSLGYPQIQEEPVATLSER